MARSAAQVGQALVDLIRDHIQEHGEVPPGLEGLVTSKHDTGLVVLEFDDNQTYRAIISEAWAPTEIIQESKTSAFGKAADAN
jgi:hypothetical protein